MAQKRGRDSSRSGKSGHAPHKAKAPASSKAPVVADDLGPMPETEDPQVIAQYYMDLLEALEHDKTVESKRLHDALMKVIGDFVESREKGGDTPEVQRKAAREIVQIGQALTELLLRSTLKLRDEIQKQSRRLGTGSSAGKAVRKAAEGLDMMVQGLQKMGQAVRENNAKLRVEAQALVDKARAAMEAVGGA